MANLKEILGENFKTLSQDLQEKYKDVDLVDSSNYVKKELFDTKETELSTTKTQLKDANKTIQSYKDMDIEAIKKSADEWKEKYENDTKDLQSKLDSQSREFAAKEFLDQHNFASDRVKKSVLKDFLDKEFKLEDGKFLGADDWIKSLSENEPEIFKAEDNTQNNPTFTKKMQTDNNTKLSLSEMMKAKNDNPNADISFK